LLSPIKDRRRQVADNLYDALVKRGASFWEHIYPLFLARDITRHDLRELVRRGLRESRGRYKSMLTLFGMPSRDYRRFMNFLAAHDCTVEFREFRSAPSPTGTSSETSPVRFFSWNSLADPAAASHWPDSDEEPSVDGQDVPDVTAVGAGPAY
jgi:hypothetical protein